jgi:isopenicillin-N epimerase
MATNREAALEGRRLLAETLHVRPPCPDEMVGSMVVLALPDGESDSLKPPLYIDPLQETLFERYGIEIPVMPWPEPPHRLLRLSAQVYRRPGEFEALARALSELIPASGQRL